MDDDDDMMMLDGTEFETAGADISPGDDGEKFEAEDDKRFFDFSSSSGDEGVGETGGDKGGKKKRDSKHQEREEEEDTESEEEGEAELSLEERLEKILPQLEYLCAVLRLSRERLERALELQHTQGTPLFSPWLFSSEAAKGVKCTSTTTGATSSKVSNGKSSHQACREKGTETPTRVIGANRLRGCLEKELNAHEYHVGKLAELRGKDLSATGLQDHLAFEHEVDRVLRAAEQAGRCSVGPYFFLLTASLEADGPNGLVAIKHWMQVPTTAAGGHHGKAKSKAKGIPKGGARTSHVDAEVGCEVDVVGCNGFRWLKIRAAKNSASSLDHNARQWLEQHNVTLKDVVSQRNDFHVVSSQAVTKAFHNEVLLASEDGAPTVSSLLMAIDPQLAKLAFCARIPAMNCCPLGAIPQLLLVLVEEPSPFLEETLETCGVGVLHFELPTTTTSATTTALNTTTALSISPLPPRNWSPRLVFFDVTALVAVCCDTCNGGAGHTFEKHHVLNHQSMDEKRGEYAIAPILSTLETYTSSCYEVKNFDLPPGEGLEPCLLAEEAKRWPLAVTALPQAPEVLGISVEELARATRPTLPTTTAPSSSSSLPTSSSTTGSTLRFSAVLRLAEEQFRAHEDPLRLNWVVSEAAWKEFCWILLTVAGKEEFLRAAELSKYIRILTDAAVPVDRLTHSPVRNDLKESTKIHSRHKEVFGVVEATEGLVLTATRQFVHAAAEQGAALAVVFHPSRALTERKRLDLESDATVRSAALAERKERQKAEREARHAS